VKKVVLNFKSISCHKNYSNVDTSFTLGLKVIKSIPRNPLIQGFLRGCPDFPYNYNYNYNFIEFSMKNTLHHSIIFALHYQTLLSHPDAL